MPIATLVGATNLLWDQEIFFPRPSFDDNLNVGLIAGLCRYLQSAAAVDDVNATQALVGMTAATAGGTGNLNAVASGGVPGGYPFIRVSGGAPGDAFFLGLEGLSSVVPTISPVDIAAGASYPSSSRVWWLQLLMRYRDDGAGNPTNQHGAIISPEDGAVHNWPTQLVGANNTGGMGIVGDGAGQWTYRSFDRTGVALVRETVALPAHTLDEYNLAEWILVGERPGAPAYFEFWFNSTLVLTRNWTGALLEPIGGNPVFNVNEWRWTPRIHIEDACSIFAAGVMRAGRYLRDGTEVTG